MTALMKNSSENCHGLGDAPRQSAASASVVKFATLTSVASVARNFPRNDSGIKVVIHGSQAALEMPRERLKQNRSSNSSASCVACERKIPATGIRAIAKMNITRRPQPA